MADRRWWERTSEQIYAYRTRKPHAAVGLPLIGRHWAYVGRTAWPARRHQEHMVGGGKWKARPKPWADLEPQRYVLCRKKARMEITTHFLEWFWIKVLAPVYNIQMNRTNPRRIAPWTQERQRAHRDRYGIAASAAPALVRLMLWASAAGVVLGLVYVGHRV